MDHALRGATAWEVARRLTEILSDSGEQSSNDS